MPAYRLFSSTEMEAKMKKSYSLSNDGLVTGEDTRLDHQAKVFWRKEQSVFQELTLGPRECLLDFGCGNGAFLSHAASLFNRTVGFDIHAKLLAKASERLPNTKFVNVSTATLEGIVREVASAKPSVVLLRFVVQHLNNAEWAILRSVATYCHANKIRLLIVDCDDNENSFEPPEPFVESAFNNWTSYTENAGGDRRLNERIASEFENWGLPAPARKSVLMVFSGDNITDFELILLRPLASTNPKQKELGQKFKEYLMNGGEITIPVFYHAI